MTVGVMAVAGRDPRNRRADRGIPTEAIVLVADRRLTESADNSVTEAWVPKIRGMIGSGASVRTSWSVLFAGDGSLIDEIKAEITGNKVAVALGKERRPKIASVTAVVTRAVKAVWARGYDAYVYEPQGLTRELFARRPKQLADLPEPVLEKLANRAAWFMSEENDFGCELALGGFDERLRSAVLDFDARGRVNRHFDTGFCTIGEGWGTASARMDVLRYQPWMDLGTVLYMAIDAKLTAERIASVGPTTDAWILLPHRPQPVVVEGGLIKELSQMRAWHDNASPFAMRRPDDPPVEVPSNDWRDHLWDFVKTCYAGSPKALSSIERAQPSWLSRTFVPGIVVRPAPARLSVPPASLRKLRRGSSRASQKRRSAKP
jgi:hypothetical protein